MPSTSTPRRVSSFISRAVSVCSNACSSSSVGALASVSDEEIAFLRQPGSRF